MSRIGKQTISLPEKVVVSTQGSTVNVQGPKGNLSVALDEHLKVSVDGQVLTVTRENEERQTRSTHGMTRALLANAIIGVSEGFTKNLEINGVGYKAEAKGTEIHLALGFSHPVVYRLPEGVSAKTPAPTKITLESIDKQSLGLAAAQVRSLRPPEPYKGKGVKYEGEHIRRKVGKTGA